MEPQRHNYFPLGASRGPWPRGRVLVALLLCALTGTAMTINVRIHQNPVVGPVNSSVLLPVSYSLLQSHSILRIQWKFVSRVPIVVVCTLKNCSQVSGWESTIHMASSYETRASIFCSNGSLLLHDIQPSDAGLYRITVDDVILKVQDSGEVNLTVSADSQDPSGEWESAAVATVRNSVRLAAAALLLCILGTIARYH